MAKRDKNENKKVKHVGCVDSVSGGIVRLVIGEDGGKAHFFPQELFPEGIKEGDWLSLTISIDDNASEKGRRAVADLYEELCADSHS